MKIFFHIRVPPYVKIVKNGGWGSGTRDNMSEQERRVGRAFTRFRMMDPISNQYFQPERLHTSRQVLEGLRSYRINVLPQLFGDMETDHETIRITVGCLVSVERVYCAGFHNIHLEKYSEILRFKIDAIKAISAIEGTEEYEKEAVVIRERFQSELNFEDSESSFFNAIFKDLELIQNHEYDLSD